jgi:hypothetical protein
VGSSLKRYVSFYFTNFPAQLSIFYLRKGFEVCGILEDVYVARKRNRFGEPYGFVKFSNVKDITKMTKALNAVWFGQFRVRASVAKFDRNAPGEEKRLEEQQVGLSKGVAEIKDGYQSPIRGEDPGPKSLVPKTASGGVGSTAVEKEGSGVRVGDIVPNFKGIQERAVRNNGLRGGKELALKSTDVPADAAKRKEGSVLLRNYRSKSDDEAWAHNGLVATVINGEAVPVVQTRISDAGFSDLVITPMGADKVFIRRAEGGDAMAIVGGAEEFFKLVFSNWTRWDYDGRPYQRGAWVRLYGVPLNAWNVDFFKLCVFDCGRFIRADSCSAEKDRLDFARVLIATTNLEIVTCKEQVLVDGVPVEIKIVEEWGYAMGEDTCLFEEENGSESSQADDDVEHQDGEVRRNVDLLVENLVDGVEGEDDGDTPRLSGNKSPPNNGSEVGDSEEYVSLTVEEANLAVEPAETHLPLSVGSPEGYRVVRNEDPLGVPECQDSPAFRISVGISKDEVSSQPRCMRAKSCPPTEERQAWPGPWSWEWLRDHNHEEAGVIFSASKRAKKGDANEGRHRRVGHSIATSRKDEGVLRHPVHSLKKIARLPNKDRGEALKALGRCVRRRRAGDQTTGSDPISGHTTSDVSSATGTDDNDWKNWVALHGNDQVVREDIRGIWQSIGVSFRGDKENMFRALSRAGKGKGENSGRPQRSEPRKEKSS